MQKISNYVAKLPFGEDIPSNVGGRSSVQGYGAADNVKQKFGGKERDNESGLDYVQDRYFSSQHGRFTSTDPVTATKKHIVNPQRWNLYVFVLNCPTSLTDPDGRSDKGKGGGKVIDVFIALDPHDPNYKPATKAEIKRRINELSPGSKAKINVYDWDGSTPDNVAQSLRSKGRTTILVGHIAGGEQTTEIVPGKNDDGTPRRGSLAFVLNGGFVTRDGVQTYTNEGEAYIVPVNIKAENLIVLSCRLSPNTASGIAANMNSGGTFVYNDGGDDGNMLLDLEVNTGILAAAGIANGQSIDAMVETLRDEQDKARRDWSSRSRELNGDQFITCDSDGRCRP